MKLNKVQSMKIQFTCQECGKNYVVDQKYAGKTGKCKNCGIKLIVPTYEKDYKSKENKLRKNILELSARIGSSIGMIFMYLILLWGEGGWSLPRFYKTFNSRWLFSTNYTSLCLVQICRIFLAQRFCGSRLVKKII